MQNSWTLLLFVWSTFYLGISWLQGEARHLLSESSEENLALLPLQGSQQLQVLHSRVNGLWDKHKLVTTTYQLSGWPEEHSDSWSGASYLERALTWNQNSSRLGSPEPLTAASRWPSYTCGRHTHTHREEEKEHIQSNWPKWINVQESLVQSSTHCTEVY